jgi:hypothetical protein
MRTLLRLSIAGNGVAAASRAAVRRHTLPPQLHTASRPVFHLVVFALL